MVTDPWRREAFLDSLSSVSSNTVAAYGRDLVGFVTWAERLELAGPDAVDRKVLRRYLAYLATRSYAKRSVAR